MNPETSDLWKSLSRSVFSNIDDSFIASFREPGGANNRLAAWDPFDRTMRYYKLMLFKAAERQPGRFFDLYRALGRVDIGNPVSVTVKSCAVNIDYFFSVEEFLFLENAFDLGRIHSVVEIGAGFGRTCHALLALVTGIEQYTIIDLASVLELSRRVLLKIVPEHFHKVAFIDAEQSDAWSGLKADLVINIDSFQEMPPSTIDSYMKNVVAHCDHFYVKNPIAKYRPEDVGIVADDLQIFHDVFSLGFCRDVIDIFDDRSLAKARETYLQAYRPSPSWELLADRPMEMFPYLHHALYCSSRQS
jgi:putative sugar O-methyltransferase